MDLVLDTTHEHSYLSQYGVSMLRTPGCPAKCPLNNPLITPPPAASAVRRVALAVARQQRSTLVITGVV